MTLSTVSETVAARAVPPMSGRSDRACNGADTELFYPSSGESPAYALALCHLCPVEAECLAWALDTGQGWGIWGGKTARERRFLLRRRAERAGRGVRI